MHKIILTMKKVFVNFFYLALFVLATFLFFNFDFRKEAKTPQLSDKWGSGIIRNENRLNLSSKDDSGENEKIFLEFEGNEDDIISLVNFERQKEGLSGLSKNEKLMESAKRKALDMKEKKYFDHISPEGLQPWFFAEQVGYEYRTMGENLAEGFFSAQSVHQAWMESEGHRKNILSADFEEIGVSIIDFEENGLKSYIIVQHFGSQLRPEDMAIIKQKLICDEKIVKQCEELEEKDDELENAIEEYEDAIKKAKKNGASKKDIKKLKDYLEEIEEIEDKVDAYLNDCKRYFEKCEEE